MFNESGLEANTEVPGAGVMFPVAVLYWNAWWLIPTLMAWDLAVRAVAELP